MQTTPSYNGPDGRAISGATSRDTLDPYTQQTVYDLPTGVTVFADPREDGFYADTPAIFDLLEARILDNDGYPNDGLGQDGNGVDGFKGFNVFALRPRDSGQRAPELLLYRRAPTTGQKGLVSTLRSAARG